MPHPHANPHDVSARVQQFLLAQGGQYASRVTEENWKQAAVALEVPPGGALPAGVWVVLPWLAPTPEQLEAWLTQVLAGPLPPQVVVLPMDVPTVRPATLRTLAATYRLEIIGISALDQQCYGTRTAALLQAIFAPNATAALAATNPLEHLAGLGDPRNPDVFFERLRRASPTVAATPWIIGANIAMFVVCVLVALGDGTSPLVGFDNATLVKLGANSVPLTVTAGQTWRLLACTFLHANLLHIAMNMYVLRSMGDLAERLFGPVAYVGVYLTSAIGGSLLSLAWTLSSSGNYSVGASGAIFGVMGGMLGFALSRRNSVPMQVYRSLLRSAAMFTVLNLALGFALQVVDNGAHIGGLVSGLVAGLVLSRDLPPAPQPTPRRLALTFTGLAAGLALAFGGVHALLGK